MAKKKLPVVLTKAQIGRSGELPDQYSLLIHGVESAPMSTDAGVDLVAYSPRTALPCTIQVKTNLTPKPGGGKGKDALDGWLPEDTPAQLVALVDLSAQRIWMFRCEEMSKLAQQRSSGRLHLFMYTDPTVKPRKAGRLAHMHEFEKYRLENRVHELLGV